MEVCRCCTNSLNAGFRKQFFLRLRFVFLFTTGNGVNGTGFADASYDALIESAAREPTPAARLAALQRAETYLLAQMPIAPLYWGSRTTLVAASVQGWGKSPLGFRNYKDVRLEK